MHWKLMDGLNAWPARQQCQAHQLLVDGQLENFQRFASDVVDREIPAGQAGCLSWYMWASPGFLCLFQQGFLVRR
jgi:hypothetical protein